MLKTTRDGATMEQEILMQLETIISTIRGMNAVDPVNLVDLIKAWKEEIPIE